MPSRQMVITNFFWRFFERSGAQIVSFVVAIVLARLLNPSEYGEIALVTILICFLQVFVDSGLGSALIQKKNSDDVDFSTVFFFNMAMSIFIYGLLFVTAPFIADFYSLPNLTSVIRIVGLALIVSGLGNIQHSFISKHLLFKKSFVAVLIGAVGSAIVGVGMAYLGYGIWALVGQYLSNVCLVTLVLWFSVKWRPRILFSFDRLKSLFDYGWKLLVSALLDTGYNQLRQLIIGKFYTTKDLAFYNQGGVFPNTIVTNVNASIDSVLFPAMSAEQDNHNVVRDMTSRAIRISTFVMMPLMVGLAACAEPIVNIVLSEKWQPCVPYLRIFCFTYAFWPIHTANLNAMKALGRSDLFLKLEIVKKIVGLVAILCTMRISVMAMAYSMLVTSVLCQIINAWPNKKLLNYSYLQQVKDMLPQIVLSVVMGTIVYSISFFGVNEWVTLVLQMITGVVIYALISGLFKMDCFIYVVDATKALFRKD